MPYNSGTGAYERRSTTVIDATPDGDTVAVAIDVKLDQGIDDYVTDINHHKTNGSHYPATSTHTDSRFLGQTPAGVVEWKDGVPAADAALKDFSNVASGAIANDKLAAIAPAKITQDASNRFVTDTEKTTWNGALYDKADVEGVLTGTITSHTHSTASESAAGLVELATTAEAAGGVDTSRAVTAAGVDAYHKAKNINFGASYTIVGNETAIDFGSTEDPIPAGVKRITVMFDGVSTNGSSLIVVRIGNGGIVASEYVSGAVNATTGAGSTAGQSSLGFIVQGAGASSIIFGGSAVINRLALNTWCFMSVLGRSDAVIVLIGGGYKTLTSDLDRLRITTINGSDLFDAGTINISWEF